MEVNEISSIFQSTSSCLFTKCKGRSAPRRLEKDLAERNKKPMSEISPTCDNDLLLMFTHIHGKKKMKKSDEH